MENKTNIKKDIEKEQEGKTKLIVGIVIGGLLLIGIILLCINLLSGKDDKEKPKKDNKDDIEDVVDDKKDDKKDDEDDSPAAVVARLTNNNNKEKEDEEEESSDPLVYRLTFNTNGGSNIDAQLYYENENTEAPGDPNRTGWTFAGWYEDSDCSTPYTFGSKLSADTTVYARWMKHVKFIVDGVVVSEKDYYENDLLKLYTSADLENDDKAASWLFNGKEIKENAIINENNFSTETSDVELVYSPKNKFTIVFIIGTGDANAVIKATEGEEIDFSFPDEAAKGEIPDLEKFAWTYEKDGQTWTFNRDQKADSSITELTLKQGVYKVKYQEKVVDEEEQETVNVIDEIEYGQDTSITVLVPEEKENKTFDGWYRVDDNSNTKVEDGYVLGEDIVVDGKWIENEVVPDEPLNDEPIVVDPPAGDNNDEPNNDEPAVNDEQNDNSGDQQQDDPPVVVDNNNNNDEAPNQDEQV